MFRLSSSFIRRTSRFSAVRGFSKKSGGEPLPNYTNLKEAEYEEVVPQPKKKTKKKKDLKANRLNWNPRMVLLNISGVDEAGIATRICRCVDKFHGTVQENRQFVLGRANNVNMLAAIPDFYEVSALESEVREKFPNFSVSVTETLGPHMFQIPMLYLRLLLRGPDSPGALLQISEVIEEQDIQIREMHAEVSQAAFASYRILSVKSIIGIPTTGFSLEGFQQSLGKFQEETGFEIDVGPVHDGDREAFQQAQDEVQSEEQQSEAEHESEQTSVDARFTDVTR